MIYRDSFRPSDLMVVKRRRASTLHPLGSFVRFASGGPIGMVTALDGDDMASVTWLTMPTQTSIVPDVCLVSESSACEVPQCGELRRNT
jgi:hypothetical protein